MILSYHELLIMNTHHIYLLQAGEFVDKKETIYKIGKTTQDNLKRFASYPPRSILLLHAIEWKG